MFFLKLFYYYDLHKIPPKMKTCGHILKMRRFSIRGRVHIALNHVKTVFSGEKKKLMRQEQFGDIETLLSTARSN